MSDINQIPFGRIITTGKALWPGSPGKPVTDDKKSSTFQDILKGEVEQRDGVKFSKHAESRLKMRNISIDESQMKKISEAVEKADKKGVQDSLVLMDKLALIVSVKNRTVITALNSDELKDNVFTNIDGAVVI